jgi:hypothetical protein
MQFPVILYRKHDFGVWPLAGHKGLHKIATANDADEMAALLDKGWFLPGFEYVPVDDVAPDAPVTRAELEQKARELGLTWHHKTGDAKLATMIAEALEG